MRRVHRVGALAILSFVVAGLSSASRAVADESAPRRSLLPIDPRDRLLEERALRIGRNVSARHVTPEGVLAYVHRRDATPAQLSADALKRADTAIWTGCYVASLACRYGVTRDPVALAEARRVAAGLDLVTSGATGTEGCLCRSVGRPIAGEEGATDCRVSPRADGLHYRADPSRDTLSGVVLGWSMLARYVDDPEVQNLARRSLLSIARRLYGDGMHVRDVNGRVTSHGRLEPKAVLGIFENGESASIGLAAILEGAVWNDAPDLWDAWRRLDRKGWVDAVDAQWTELGDTVESASDRNMVHMALLCLGLDAKGKPQRHAMAALRDMRRHTRGWQNGGFLSCALLAGQEVGRAESVAELREALLGMPADEVPLRGTTKVEVHEPVPTALRPNGEWLWKSSSFRFEEGREDARPDPTTTFTRADFLYAYWLARAAGELSPHE
jgi:hypothetical protein